MPKTLLVALLALSTACSTGKIGGDSGTVGSDGGATGSDGGGDGGSATAEDWCGVLSIINSQCLSCHSAGARLGDLDLETDPHGTLVSGASSYPGRTLVVPGNSAESFLVIKLEGTQAAGEGDSMPPGSPLSSADIDVVRTWIDNGASDSCSGGGDTGATGTYHPDGYADPTVHGMEAKLHEQTCTDCHGADLAGAGDVPSCDTCHDDGWRTNCTFCHGGIEDSTGAPPEDIDDGTSDAAFGAHPRHVQTNTHAAFDCTQCHVKPTDVLSSGHLFDSTAAQAEVDFSSSLSSRASWSSGAMSCSNLYCHGNGRADNGSVSISDAPLSCHSCHPDASSSSSTISSMSGAHRKHVVSEGVRCEACHADTIDASNTVIGPALHVNGTPDVAISSDYPSISYRSSSNSCTGNCHGEGHENENWYDDR
ncbi:MAG: hypothetical protein D6798_08530 [Deltaproteobacteria bacterium]|nr:MAG: hypothetical protein D6798_08530 [Deltaproteobacteria bacterium]